MQLSLPCLALAAAALCLPACDHPSPDHSSAAGPAQTASTRPAPRTHPSASVPALPGALAIPVPDKPKVPMGPDGLPVSIPLPGSRLPTVRDWDDRGQRIQLDHADELGCETQMIREWIRLTCKADKAELGQPQSARTRQQAGAPAYIFARKGKMLRVETQLVPGRTYQAELTWETGKRVFEIRWPKGEARPRIRLFDPEAERSDPKNDANDGDRKHSDRKHGDRKHSDHKHGDRKHSDHKHGDHKHSDRKHGDRKHSDRKHGDRDNPTPNPDPRSDRRPMTSPGRSR